jgi:hypothetical protein
VRLFLHSKKDKNCDASTMFFLNDLVCGNFFGERAMISETASFAQEDKNQTAIAVTYSELVRGE